mmetsp:Transcript_34630/g.35319  ORF Transcript_34630/g.35319 Transcript_34630/m.35319 type:complete len:474 (+) Transcript_34630:55-1476(+)|eukprot:CAMPEP_0182429034 /NCGR_PEP_ID=MMETSP1167-20130531/25465_1 /TAXON_ID=2988 /ORGANISM="Mallomonas Sp, Strain CCMP3275" /LENGTH=473 /DNA_ID=CAMNT_0024612333 /DNA_START=33 /DNA_END=1454 /DNA_ORIENTATION=-
MTEIDLSRIDILERTMAEISAKVSAEGFGADFSHRRLGNGTRMLNDDLDTGDTAWMLMSCALVLLMTLPGLALFYGGMQEKKNVLTTAMQAFSIACLVTFLWLSIGYSLSFGPVDSEPENSVIGDSSRMWLDGLEIDSMSGTIPESVFIVFQLTFAIITPTLAVGAFGDRVKYGSLLIFVTLWLIFAYCPIAHANWHGAGILHKLGAVDFAGGNVVHISSGVAGLVATVILGKRKGFGTEHFEPHNILLSFIGASMLWFGWFGFNAGSAIGANSGAGYAMITTIICTAVAAITWTMAEYMHRKQTSLLGMVSGVVAGLVAITPACGFVDPTGAFVIGVVAGPWCFYGARLKSYLGYDDACDAFGVHGTGGLLGGLMTGLFAQAEISGTDGAFYGNGELFGFQLAGCLLSGAWSAVVTAILVIAIEKSIGFRVSTKDEAMGLDESIHGEVVGTDGGPSNSTSTTRGPNPVQSLA